MVNGVIIFARVLYVLTSIKVSIQGSDVNCFKKFPKFYGSISEKLSQNRKYGLSWT